MVGLFFLVLSMCCLHCCFVLLFLENGSRYQIPSNFDGGLRMVFWKLIVVFGAFNQENFPNLRRHQKTKIAKPLDALNLYRHQKKQKTKSQQLVRKHGHRFVVFGVCAGLVMVTHCFFVCEVKLTKPAQAPNKTKEPNH